MNPPMNIGKQQMNVGFSRDWKLTLTYESLQLKVMLMKPYIHLKLKLNINSIGLFLGNKDGEGSAE